MINKYFNIKDNFKPSMNQSLTTNEIYFTYIGQYILILKDEYIIDSYTILDSIEGIKFLIKPKIKNQDSKLIIKISGDSFEDDGPKIKNLLDVSIDYTYKNKPKSFYFMSEERPNTKIKIFEDNENIEIEIQKAV